MTAPASFPKAGMPQPRPQRPNARRGGHALPGAGGQARRFVERPAAATFDDPEVGAGVLDQPDAVGDVAAVDAVHHQHDGQQQRHGDDGGGGGGSC